MKRFAIIAHDHADASDKRRNRLAAHLAHIEQQGMGKQLYRLPSTNSSVNLGTDVGQMKRGQPTALI